MADGYIINVVTQQTVDGEQEQLEMTTTASLEGQDDDYYIVYTDEDENLAQCKTTLHVENGSYITIRREGVLESHLVLEKDRRHISHHVTPYGAFSMGFATSEVRSAMKTDGGTLYFKYSTDVDLMPVGDMEFKITISPIKH